MELMYGRSGWVVSRLLMSDARD